MKNNLRHLSSFIAPFIMCLVLPWLITWLEHKSPAPKFTPSALFLIAGLGITILGLALFITTIRMFILIGNGTIMPWDPTPKLIVASLYSYVRNPMITSLILIQVGEAVLFASVGIAILAIFDFVFNTIYFILSEEPGLEKRFGADYVEYKKNVPRWIPRLKPWRPNDHQV
jgi:protein-S-isoprenylcysteine O-methyltransferase Ste14